jgi:hypothetical protein
MTVAERGRPTLMDDPENVKLFAELYSAGATRAQIGEVFGVHEDTVTRWTKRPDVQALVSDMRQQRANRILRKVEGAIEARLENEDSLRKMDLKDLLAIKREFTPQRVEVGRAGDFDALADMAAWEALDAGEAPAELMPPPEEDADG